MGDRANVCIEDGTNPPIYFYTHWKGSRLPELMATGLKRGESRWGDPAYLARILFCELIAHPFVEMEQERDDRQVKRMIATLTDTVSFGISGSIGDNEPGRPVLVIDCATQTVSTRPVNAREGGKYKRVTFREFVENPQSLRWN